MSEHALTLPASWLGRRQPIDIALVGAGGNGSEMADRLGKLATVLRATGGPSLHVTVIDGDIVTASNCGRQRFVEADIGNFKAITLVHRLNAFYRQTWDAVPRYATAEELAKSRFDLVITCVDKAIFRAELGMTKVYGERLWMDLGNNDLAGNTVIGHFRRRDKDESAKPRIPNVFDLFPQLAHMSAADIEQPSCSTEEAIRRQALPINPQCADLAFQLLYFLFREQKLTHHGFQFRLNPLQVTPIACDPMTWSFYGYKAPRRRVTKPADARRIA